MKEISNFKEFKRVAECCLRSGTLRSGDFLLNDGWCYVPTINGGRGFTGGDDRDLKVAWRYVKKYGSFSISSSYFNSFVGEYVLS